ncbi:U4/U6-U5 snRNP complex subunit lsm3, partial [Perkinsus olseni]
GRLVAYDSHLNMVLSEVEEVIEPPVKEGVKPPKPIRRELDTIFVITGFRAYSSELTVSAGPRRRYHPGEPSSGQAIGMRGRPRSLEGVPAEVCPCSIPPLSMRGPHAARAWLGNDQQHSSSWKARESLDTTVAKSDPYAVCARRRVIEIPDRKGAEAAVIPKGAEFAVRYSSEEKEASESYRSRLREARLLWLAITGRKIHPCHSVVAAFLEPVFNGYDTTSAHKIQIPTNTCATSTTFRPWTIDCADGRLCVCEGHSEYAYIDRAWISLAEGVPICSAVLGHGSSPRVLSTHLDGTVRIDGECIFNLEATGQSVARWVDDTRIAVVTSKGGRCYLIRSPSGEILAHWGGFLYPCDVAVAQGGGQLLIADTLNRRVVEICPTTDSRRVVIEGIYARALCVSQGTGHVMVSDGLTGSVRIFSSDFRELHSWRIPLPDPSSSVRGLAIAEGLHLYVCDSASSCVWRFTQTWL